MCAWRRDRPATRFLPAVACGAAPVSLVGVTSLLSSTQVVRVACHCFSFPVRASPPVLSDFISADSDRNARWSRGESDADVRGIEVSLTACLAHLSEGSGGFLPLWSSLSAFSVRNHTHHSFLLRVIFDTGGCETMTESTLRFIAGKQRSALGACPSALSCSQGRTPGVSSTSGIPPLPPGSSGPALSRHHPGQPRALLRSQLRDREQTQSVGPMPSPAPDV